MTDEKKLQATITDRKRVYDGFFKIDELTIDMDRHDGTVQTVKRMNFERGNAVGILGYDKDLDRVVLTNEMRPGMLAAGEYPFNDSVSAGMIDAGETATQAAKREWEEETGHEIEDLKLVHAGAYVSAGGTSERLALTAGFIDSTEYGGVHGEVDEGESINSVILPADEYIARAEDGRLKDMKSLALAFWLARHRDEFRNSDAPVSDASAGQMISGVLDEKKEEKLNATITNRKTLYEGVFKIEELTIDMDKHGGGTQTLKRLNYERGDAVAVLGYDQNTDEVVLVNEMRTGMLAAGDYPYADTLPAAMMARGADAIDAAKTTMQRETGATLNNPAFIHPGAFVSAGGTSEKIALVFGTVDAEQARGLHGRAEKGEDIQTVVMKADDFIKAADEGRIKDMKSLTCAFWFALHRDELRASAPQPDAPFVKKITNILGK